MNTYLIWLFVLSFGCSQVAGLAEDSSNTTSDGKYFQTLIFGGNGFIGSELVSQLRSSGEHRLYVVNRGSVYYDSKERVMPYVTHVDCDRFQGCPSCGTVGGLKACEEFQDVVQKVGYFDFVVDLSGYRPDVIRDAVVTLRNKVGIYIYISTDSVYEVSEAAAPNEDTEDVRETTEEEAIRPLDHEEGTRLNERDDYGHNKLEGEEVLRHLYEIKVGPPWVALRLSDLIGPRDTTLRWWIYQMWMENYDVIEEGIYLPEEVAHLQTSYTFVKDVPRAVMKVMELSLTDRRNEVVNQSYNIAMSRRFTLANLLLEMSLELGAGHAQGNYDPPSNFHLYPSVRRGPVDIGKARRLLDFTPTDWQEALTTTVAFYQEAVRQFPRERDDVLHRLLNSIFSISKGRYKYILDTMQKRFQGIYDIHDSKQEL